MIRAIRMKDEGWRMWLPFMMGVGGVPRFMCLRRCQDEVIDIDLDVKEREYFSGRGWWCMMRVPFPSIVEGTYFSEWMDKEGSVLGFGLISFEYGGGY